MTKAKSLTKETLLRVAAIALRESSVTLAETASALEKAVVAEAKLAELAPAPSSEGSPKLHSGTHRFKGHPGKVAHRCRSRAG
jgi:hypothetical protein